MSRIGIIVCLVAISNFAMASTVLVTGSNRGIGLEFVTQYSEKGWDVIATSRTPQDDKDLQALAEAHSNITIETLDVTNVDSIAALAEKYREKPIDLLINNAGLLGDPPSQSWGDIDQDTFTEVMATNVFGPLKVSEAFSEHVAASNDKKIVVLSSSVGSIGSMNSPSRMPIFQTSKAAVNMSMRVVAMQLKDRDVVVAMLDPGRTQTRMMRQAMGMSFEDASKETDFEYPASMLPPNVSVSKLISVIESMDRAETGVFLSNDGSTIPW
jgi:NAD(P)-dependent dehydrogenase (short-subunit alcohol dehydrogenase family)